jgi:diamine N-acetyltransferase
VGPAAYTVAESHYEPGALLRAVYLDDRPVGVLAVEVESGTPYLVRFMIDAAHQRRGWKTLETSFVPAAGGAKGFWRRCGFDDTGRRIHDEPVFARRL